MKQKISISISPELLDWIDQEVTKRTYADRSHAFECGVLAIQRANVLETLVSNLQQDVAELKRRMKKEPETKTNSPSSHQKQE